MQGSPATRRRLPRLAVLLLALAALGLAACGGDDDNGDEQAGAGTETETEAPDANGGNGGGGGGAPGSESVGMTEFSFGPSDVVIEEGGTVTAQNEGSIVHNFTIEEGTNPEQPSDELLATPDVNAGDNAELAVDLPPGEYALVCTIPGHREQGMVGSVTVESSGG